MAVLRSALVGSGIFALALLAAVLVAACFSVFALGQVDEKWGDAWGNVQLVFYFYGLLVARSSAVIFAALVLLFRPSWATGSFRRLGVVSSSSGVVAGVVALSGILKWLSQFIDARSSLQLASLAALPGVVSVAVVATLLLAQRKWQRA